MAKIVLNDVTSGYNLTKIRDNFTKIADALNLNVYWRNNPIGEANALITDMDANGKRIYNLPDPTDNGQPVSLGYLISLPNSAAASAIAAAASAVSAANSAASASASASLIANWSYRNTWTTATAYLKNNIVVGTGTYTGWSLIALSNHTSTGATTDTDYTGGKWGILSQRGAAGAGSGDMLGANNLSDVVSASSSRTNLGSTPIGDALFTSASAAAARTTLGLGTAAVLNVGTAANNIVQLDGSAKLPALDGSQLTNLPSTGGFITGMGMDWWDTVLPSGGWIFMDGRTIGNASSGATNRANADTVNLYTMFWNRYSNTLCPVSGGRGASAAADYAANKTITILDKRGRVSAGVDNMGGTTASRITVAGGNYDGTVLGASGGLQNHILTTGEMPSHNHPGSAASLPVTQDASGNPPNYLTTPDDSGNFLNQSRPVSLTIASQGSNTAHTVLNPVISCNYIIKL